MAIRITAKDKSDYTKLRAKINKKIKYGREFGIDLTSEIDLKPLKEFTTRAEYNEFKAQAKTFTHRHNTRLKFTRLADGSAITVKEFNEVVQNTKISNRHREKELRKIAKIEGKHEKKKNILSQHEFGNQEIQMLTVPKSSGLISNRSQFNRLVENRKRQAETDYLLKRASDSRENFLQTLEYIYGDAASELIDKFRSMDANEFWFIYKNNEDFKEVFYGSEKYLDMDYDEHIEDSYQPPKLQILESAYNRFMEEKNSANNR